MVLCSMSKNDSGETIRCIRVMKISWGGDSGVCGEGDGGGRCIQLIIGELDRGIQVK